MRLRELEAQFLRWEAGTSFRRQGDSVAAANGLLFVCPLCFLNANLVRPGVHSVICWAPDVPQSVSPGPGRWTMVGTSLDDLTLVAGSSSVQLLGGCGAHFFVRDGGIEMC